MLVVAGWSGHTLAFGRVPVASDCIQILTLFLWLVLTWHGGFSSVTLGLTEEKVLIGIGPDLKIDNVTHVFVILYLMNESLFTGIFFLNLIFLELNLFIFFNILHF